MINEGKFKAGGHKPQPESSTRPPPPKPANPKSIAENSQIALWQSYCDKKVECEMLREKLAETLDILEYAHISSESQYDYDQVSDFIGEMYKFLEDCK